jgi:hypothetical protein
MWNFVIEATKGTYKINANLEAGKLDAGRFTYSPVSGPWMRLETRTD